MKFLSSVDIAMVLKDEGFEQVRLKEFGTSVRVSKHPDWKRDHRNAGMKVWSASAARDS